MITDWLMVAITAVYVVATIFICRANIKSADATREQVAEAKRQYEEEHRAYISYEFIYERRAFYGKRRRKIDPEFPQKSRVCVCYPQFSEKFIHNYHLREKVTVDLLAETHRFSWGSYFTAPGVVENICCL